MKQQCIYLHTTKDLAETETILKNEGMQIVFQSDDAEIKFSDMTEEEKISWLKSMHEDLDVQIIDMESNRTAFQLEINFIEKKFVDVVNLLKDDNYSNVDEKYKKIVKEMSEIDQHYYKTGDWRNCVTIDHGIIRQSKLRCSCLIAKTGTDVVRYLSFLNDPILTITGKNATNLKSSLEGKF